MITELLLLALLPSISGLLGLLPAATLNLSALSNVTSIGAQAAMLNGYFPVGTIGTCLGVVKGLKVFMLGYRALLFIYHQFWGSN